MKSKTFGLFLAIYLSLAAVMLGAAIFFMKLPAHYVLGDWAAINLGFFSMYGLHQGWKKLSASNASKNRVTALVQSTKTVQFPPECIDILRMTKAEIDAEIKSLEPVMNRGAVTYKTYADLLKRMGAVPADDLVLTIDDGEYVKACYRDMHLRHVRNMLFPQPSSQAKAIFS